VNRKQPAVSYAANKQRHEGCYLPLQTNPVVRRAGRVLPSRLRALGARVLRQEPAERSAVPTAPLVSIIVPVYNVEEYLEECLASVRAQTHERLEILLIDDGSTDGSSAIAQTHATEDARIRIVRQANAGLGAARNTGIRHATGEFLCFVDSDDILRHDAVRAMVTSAEESGSDMVVCAAVRFNEEGRTRPAWVDELHVHRRTGISVVDYPEIVRNNYTWNKLFRTAFWHRCGLWFREGVSYEDQPIITQLYARASTIDVLPTIVYEWRKRSDRTSISQQTHTIRDLQDRIAAWDISQEVLAAEAPRPVYEAWLKTLYTTHFHWYLNNRSTADDEYWRVLQTGIARITESVPAGVLATVEPQLRLAVELARRDLHAEFLEFRRREGYVLDRFPARLTDEGLDFHLPTRDEPGLDIPASMYRLDDEHIPLTHRLDTATWTDQGSLRVAGWAYFRYVDLHDLEPEISLVLTHRRSGQQVEVGTTRDPDRSLVQPDDDGFADYDPASFAAELPVSELLAGGDASDGDELALTVSVRAGRLHRTTEVMQRHVGGSARFLRPFRVGGGIVFPADNRITGSPFLLRYSVPASQVVGLDLHAGQLSGRLVADPGAEAQELVFDAIGSAGVARGAFTTDERGGFTVSVPERIFEAASSAPNHRARWALRVRSGAAAGALTQVDRPEDQHSWVGGRVVSLRQSHKGSVVLETSAPFVEVDSASVADEELKLSGRAPGMNAGAVSIFLHAPKASSVVATADLTEGAFSVAIPLTHNPWGFDTLGLPSGPYSMRAALRSPDGTTSEGPAQVSENLAELLPRPFDGDWAAVTLYRDKDRGLQCQLLPPVGRDARGRYRRTRLERASASVSHPGPLDGLLIETYFGELAGCSGAAVHHELRRRGADLPVYWTVRDRSVRVPEGGIPVIRNSPEWYEVLRSAKYLIDNMYQPLFHSKPEGQTIITTFHGYPFKEMGYPHWRRNLDHSQERLDLYATRTKEWNYLVSPARYATPLLRENFGYAGPVLEIGYPRNDVLLSPEAPQIRTDTRNRLGVGEQQIAVLYAPTFRDYLAVNDSRAPMVDFLDIERLSTGLGPEYVILVRGHAFNRRVPKRLKREVHVIDVTDYPDPADLCLASDVAVLDYSSIRFDYGVTGKPMVFMVPDLDRYQNARGWLLDYEPTAPGPLLGSTDEVVSAIADLDSTVSSHAEAYQRFQQDYLDLEDGQAAARLVDAVFVPAGDAPPRGDR
jgi:CDP-glycerol glycerophosphotransferase